jgi:hypothetical protein
MVEPVRHRQTKEAGTDMFEPKATAPHLDSTATKLRRQHALSHDFRQDGEPKMASTFGRELMRVRQIAACSGEGP